MRRIIIINICTSPIGPQNILSEPLHELVPEASGKKIKSVINQLEHLSTVKLSESLDCSTP